MLKELTDQAVKKYSDPQMRLNFMREQLQRVMLVALHDARAFNHIAFVGGTCLRIVHGLRRYSEDLDFSLTRPEGYDFPRFLQKIKSRLNALGIEHSIKVNTKKTVHVAQIRLPMVRRLVGENPMADAKLTIKLEVDTNPPQGWGSEHHILQSDLGLAALVAYDLPSLFSGKLHALCCRNHVKGRDWYDLLWYLAKQPPVVLNTGLLTHAVAQTEGDKAWPGEHWRTQLLERLRTLDLQQVKTDIAPFIERKDELELFQRELLEAKIKQS